MAAADDYAAQIDRWAALLSKPISADGAPAAQFAGIDSRSLLSEVQDFASECFDKRVDKILAFCPLLSEGSLDLKEQAVRFLLQQKSGRAETSRRTAGRFLNWLESQVSLTPEDADRLACDRGWLLVEERAQRCRNDYVRFEERRSRRTMDETDRQDILQWRFLANPTQVDVLLSSTLFLAKEATPPAAATFHAGGERVRVLLIPKRLRELAARIASRPGVSGAALQQVLRGPDAESLTDDLIQLTKRGLTAVL